MERPIRSFETVFSVTASWHAEKTVNSLMARKTLFAPVLSTSAIPSSSPMCSGYVQWEYKRGKWQKRWMELREHSLFLSKKDNGKDSTCLCSLSNFDAYAVTRVSKAPKPFVFTIKSTDNLSFFENTADYMHTFACGEKDGQNWLEKILVARSYLLYQERNVLAASGTGITNTTSLSRAGTRKQRPVQPLVNFFAAPAVPDVPISASQLAAPSSSAAGAAPPPIAFEPGSLLAKRAT